MKLRVYTLLPYQNSDRCNEVNDITVVVIWVISERVHFTKKTNSFPGNFIEGFNGCHMKAFVRDGHWGFYYEICLVQWLQWDWWEVNKWLAVWFIKVIHKHLNMTFVHVTTPEGAELEKVSLDYLIFALFAKHLWWSANQLLRFLAFHSTNP